MALSRGYLLLSVVLLAVFVAVAVADMEPSKESSVEPIENTPVKSLRSMVRSLRAARAQQQRGQLRGQHPAGAHRSTVAATTTPVPVSVPVPDTKQNPQDTPECQYEQQVLVVKGNPSEEVLNDEIRKAIRALLGPEQSEQVQIRELKSEDELRRVAPGARPVGVRLVP
uniref:Uncharacterized protein n=1 Tax=Anopheles farauti TaxID=69004 RepID=A0A182Q3G3_9DIPT